jgi:hypothetical protein
MKNEIDLDSPIDVIKWPPHIRKLLRGKWFLIDNIWSIYYNDVMYNIPQGWVGKKLLELKEIDETIYDEINTILTKHGLPDLKEAPRLVREDEGAKIADINEGNSSG